MNVSGVRLLLCGALLGTAGSPLSQDTGTVHDAPYLPTPRVTLYEMLQLAEVGPADIVYDLGSGDGRIVIAAARDFGARAVGIERDPRLVAQSAIAAERAGVAGRVRFVRQDLFDADLREASVVTLYLSPNLNLKLRPALLQLRPGTRVVSHGSDLGDWRPDRKTSVRKDVYLWFVPARVSGRWISRFGFADGERRLEIEFSQRHQEISARAWLERAPLPVWEARLQSDRVSFVIVEADARDDGAGLYFQGRIARDTIVGTVSRGYGGARTAASWRAARARP